MLRRAFRLSYLLALLCFGGRDILLPVGLDRDCGDTFAR